MSDETNIIILGPPSVGKTTYLATLAYYFDTIQGRQIEVEAIGADAESLQDDAENILMTRDSLAASKDVKNYKFRIRIPSQMLRGSGEIIIEVSDYAGEIFKRLNEDPIPSDIGERISQCSQSKKWLLLLNDWEPKADSNSRRRLEALLKQVPPDVKNSLRIAVVMSKCERGELWTRRREPEEDIFAVHLPKTWALLRNKIFRERPQNLKFFACSSFGVLDNKEPLPNRVNVVDGDHKNAVLRNPAVWKPYGLITPFVWLDRGLHWRWEHL
jgi:GTPase SAR1 family protein